MNLGKILLILVVALINKAFTGNVRHNLAPLELNGDLKNNLGQMELNAENRWFDWGAWNWVSGKINEAKNWINDRKGEIWKLVEDAKWIKDEIASKVEDVKQQAKKWKEEATNLLSNALEEKFNLDDLKESKCYSASMNALAGLGEAKSTIVKQFEDQKENFENGKFDEAFGALKDIASETGDTFKKFEEAAGCLAKKFGYKAYSISVGVTKGAGATAEKEMGIAKSFGKKDMMLFSSLCKGLKSDVGIEKKLTIALWKNIDSIEGAVYPLTYGLSTPAPLPSVAAASGIVVAKKSGWTVLTPWLVEKIGTEFSVSLGAGVSPVDISFSQCTSKVHKRYKANDEENDVTTLEWSQYQKCLLKESSKNWIEFRKCLMG